MSNYRCKLCFFLKAPQALRNILTFGETHLFVPLADSFNLHCHGSLCETTDDSAHKFFTGDNLHTDLFLSLLLSSFITLSESLTFSLTHTPTCVILVLSLSLSLLSSTSLLKHMNTTGPLSSHTPPCQFSHFSLDFSSLPLPL